MTREVITGDCVEVMQGMDESSVDAVVCDPPYGLEFMGKEWDSFKATGNFAGGGPPKKGGTEYTRSQGRERKGFDGYSPSPRFIGGHAAQEWHQAWATEALRVLKPGGHLLAFGGTRTSHRLVCAIEDAGFEIRDTIVWLYGSGFPKSHNLNGEHKGWGTALKPAHEPIVVARKPLTGTVAQNVLEHGTGALNVDGCRVSTVSAEDSRRLKEWPRPNSSGKEHKGVVMNRPAAPTANSHDAGRWPANLVLDEQAAAGLDGQSGASRFFYVAKASRRERGEANSHPTVKPLTLMRWLCRLVTPPNGLVLDPFTGSGTTGCAAVLEGFDFIGIEKEPEYVEIAKARIAHWAAQPQQQELAA